MKFKVRRMDFVCDCGASQSFFGVCGDEILKCWRCGRKFRLKLEEVDSDG